MFRKALGAVAGGLLALAATPLAALPGDVDGEIVFEADESMLDRERGVAIYRGNVRVERGSIEIRGDTLELRVVDEELVEAVIRGTPATFVQTHDGGRAPTRAEAAELVYDVVAGQVYLRGAVRVIQGGNEVVSEDLRYDLDSERVVAGGESGSRVRVTIQPRQQDDDADDDPEPRP